MRNLEAMKKFEAMKEDKRGFSLVELIVVIAIMAVLVAVLAPALLRYVENSRAQKDDSAMGEVANAIQLALADQDVYDEMLFYTVSNNFSCYTDGDTTTNVDANKVTGTNGYEFYNDQTRLKDETAFKGNGNMRGVTITFNPVKNTKASTFVLADADVNDMFTHSNGNAAAATRTLTYSDQSSAVPATTLSTASADNTNHYLYNQVRASIGDEITLTSQTYRNSSYTVFIKMGTTGGAETAKQDAIQVYGQWGGTNLHVNAAATGTDH